MYNIDYNKVLNTRKKFLEKILGNQIQILLPLEERNTVLKRNKLGIKWNIFVYLLIFTVILLILLWLLQTVLLEDFYKTVKAGNIKEAGEEIALSINRGKDDLKNTINRITYENYINIRIVDEKGNNLADSEEIVESLIHKIKGKDLQDLYMECLKKGGSKFKLFSRIGNSYVENIEEDFIPPYAKGNQSMVYLKTIKANDGNNYMIMLNSIINPIDTTVETIRIQLMIISFILIILSIVIAFFMSRKISRPIIKINESAKDVAKGNYNTVFEGTGYLEIEELNNTLNYTTKELSKVENLRKELIANISHDLRSPLTMIAGYAEVMRDIPGENSKENIQIIIDEAKYLSNLVKEILDISEIESGNTELKFTQFNITSSIRKILERYESLTRLKGYKINLNYNNIEAFICADEMKISQVLYNLINNAIEYTGKDKEINVNQIIKKDSILIEVVDQGDGIEEELIPHIWDRYYRSKNNSKKAKVGSGLGLSIVKDILEMHNAKFGVVSTKGVGSTFWFELKKNL